MRILALSRESGSLPSTGYVPASDMRDLLQTPISTMNCWHERNDALENNTDFLQLIPVAYLMDSSGRIAYYQRRANHTEERLGGLHTIWFGGHVDETDRKEQRRIFMVDIMKDALYRELQEEATLTKSEITSMSFLSYFQLADKPVSKVHAAFAFRVLITTKAMDRLASFSKHGIPDDIEPAYIGVLSSMDSLLDMECNWEPWAAYYLDRLRGTENEKAT